MSIKRKVFSFGWVDGNMPFALNPFTKQVNIVNMSIVTSTGSTADSTDYWSFKSYNGSGTKLIIDNTQVENTTTVNGLVGFQSRGLKIDKNKAVIEANEIIAFQPMKIGTPANIPALQGLSLVIDYTEN